MEHIIDFLTSWGYFGLAICGLFASSIVPFLSTDLIMIALVASGLDAWTVVIVATIANTMGGCVNYSLGHLGHVDWMEQHTRIKKEKIQRVEKFIHNKGAWTGIFASVPFFGNVVTVVLGLMRCNIIVSILSVAVGKFIRYSLVIFGIKFFI